MVCGGSESEGGTRRVVGVGMVVRHVDDGDCDAGEGGERREGAEAALGPVSLGGEARGREGAVGGECLGEREGEVGDEEEGDGEEPD